MPKNYLEAAAATAAETAAATAEDPPSAAWRMFCIGISKKFIRILLKSSLYNQINYCKSFTFKQRLFKNQFSVFLLHFWCLDFLLKFNKNEVQTSILSNNLTTIKLLISRKVKGGNILTFLYVKVFLWGLFRTSLQQLKFLWELKMYFD